MLSKEELEKNYSEFSNEELLVIADSGNDYTPLAIEVAQNEITKRNISAEEIQRIEKVWEEKIKDIVIKNYIIELSMLEKMLFYFLWIIQFVTEPFRQNFRDDGLMLKYNQSIFFRNMSIAFLFAASIAAIGLAMPMLEGLWFLGFIITNIIDSKRGNQVEEE